MPHQCAVSVWHCNQCHKAFPYSPHGYEQAVECEERHKITQEEVLP